MLFNSYEFLFAFLPVTLAGFFLLGKISRNWALGWLMIASLVFYAWWRPINVLIIAPSVLINFILARVLLRLGTDQRQVRLAQAVLVLGIAFNVVFLGYFKYVNFFYTALNDVTGTNFVLAQVILPLGISFITFQKIAFLIDVHARRVESFTLHDFFLFVLFFPQLIAGPIVHFREMMPQFHQVSCRFDKEHVSVGLTLLVFGLFKKVVLADSLAPTSRRSMRRQRPAATSLCFLHGLRRSDSPCKSISTSPGTATWPWAWAVVSASSCPPTSTRH